MAGRYCRTAVLHFPCPMVVDSGDLIVFKNGEIEMVAEAILIEDYVCEQAQEDSRYLAMPSDEFFNAHGDVTGRIPARCDAYLVQLNGGKDAWHYFDDYEDALSAIVTGFGSPPANKAAVRRSRQYWGPSEDQKFEYAEAARDVRAEIRAP